MFFSWQFYYRSFRKSRASPASVSESGRLKILIIYPIIQKISRNMDFYLFRKHRSYEKCQA